MVSNIEIVKYDSSLKKEWDNFLKTAKNSHFFFSRDYMEYHSDRFFDSSLMVYVNEKLLSIFPANRKENILYSHAGLTFGGFITDENMNAILMVDIFKELINYSKKEGIQELIYKAVPYIYHTYPAEEDRYALFVFDAILYRRDITATLYLEKKINYQERRVRGIKKADKANLKVTRSDDFDTFWKILEENLKSKYNTVPVHSIDEIKLLYSRFPENIKLYVTTHEGEIIAGTVVFINNEVVHCQYIASNEYGKTVAALDILFDTLINEYRNKKKYFDFGISNEKEGKYLNEGLIQFKESFGARAIAHDFYRIKI